MKNQIYTGSTVYNRHTYHMAGKHSRLSYEVKDGKKEPVLKPESERIIYEAPNFIDELTWNRIQRKIAVSKKWSKHSKFPDKFLAQGLVYCGVCGGRVGIKNGVKTKQGNVPHYYICHWAFATPKYLELVGKEKCRLPSILMKDLDEEVWNRIKVILSNPARLMKEWSSTPQADKGNLAKKYERIEAEIKSNQSAIRRLLSKYAHESNEDISNQVTSEIKKVGYLTGKLKEDASVIKTQLDVLSKTDSLLEEMGHAEFTRDILRAMNKVSDKDRKHIVRIILSPEDGGKIFLRPKRPVDDYVGDPVRLTAEFFEEIPQTYVADWSFKLRAEKIRAAVSYLKDKGVLSSKFNKAASQYFREH